MENGFSFELYGETFKNCFIHSSNYRNGNLQLSLFGVDPKLNQTAHFADITLNQNKLLSENEIVVYCKFKPTLIPQLLNLGILKKQTGICVVNSTIYPIFTVDLTKIAEMQYFIPELIAA